MSLDDRYLEKQTKEWLQLLLSKLPEYENKTRLLRLAVEGHVLLSKAEKAGYTMETLFQFDVYACRMKYLLAQSNCTKEDLMNLLHQIETLFNQNKMDLKMSETIIQLEKVTQRCWNPSTAYLVLYGDYPEISSVKQTPRLHLTFIEIIQQLKENGQLIQKWILEPNLKLTPDRLNQLNQSLSYIKDLNTLAFHALPLDPDSLTDTPTDDAICHIM